MCRIPHVLTDSLVKVRHDDIEIVRSQVAVGVQRENAEA